MVDEEKKEKGQDGSGIEMGRIDDKTSRFKALFKKRKGRKTGDDERW